MASLTDKRIKNTYDGLLKTTDNDPLGGSYKLITDGLGNSSNVYLGTGGAVGIGQGSPRGKFDVDGEVYVTTPNGIDSLKISDLSVKIGDYDDANGYAFLHLDSQVFKFTTDSAEVMRITSDGKVGIGTDSPAAGLQVSKGGTTIPTAGSNTAAAVFGNSTSDDNYGVAIGANSSGVGYISSQRTDGTATTYNLAIQPNGGKVGIGTDSPDTKLELYGSQANGDSNPFMALKISFLHNNGNEYVTEYGNNQFKFGSNHSYYVYQNTSKILQLQSGTFQVFTNNTEKLRVNSSGNVGIGTTSPVSSLEISKQLSAVSAIDYLLTVSSRDDGNSINQAGGEGVGIKFRIAGNDSSTPGNSLVGASIAAIRKASSDSDSSTNLAFFTTQNDENLDESMRITSDGKVGIGTTSPSFKFDVVGDGIRNIRSTAGWAGWFQNNASSSGVIITAGVDSGDAPLLVRKQDTTEIFSIRGNGTSYFQNGNVGIGLTSPSQKLEIDGNILLQNNDEIRFRNSAGTERTAIELDPSNNFNIGTSAGGNLRFINGSSYTERMRITSAGNVGIGTTSPYTNFEVVGKGSFGVAGSSNLGVEISSVSAIPTAQVKGYIASATSGAGGGNGDLLIASRTNASTNIRFFAGSTSERMRIDSSGNVGIGTTSPSKKLHVATTGSVDVAKFETTGNTSILIERTASLQPGAAKLTVANNGQLKIASDNLIKFATSGHSGGTERMRINNDGKVGIGTTSPGHKLTVLGGNIQTDGIVYANTIRDNTGGDVVIQDNSGNVGIGTTSPNTTLEVGDCDSSDNIADGNIAVKTNTNNTAIVIQEASGAEQWGLGVNADGDLIFTDSGTERIRIDDGTGNVGIGTTSPAVKLHTFQPNENWIYVETSGTDAIGGLRTQSSTGARQNTLYRNVTTNLLTLRSGTDDGEIQFIAGGGASERMRIAADGGLFVYDLLASTSVSNPQIRFNISTKELYYQSSSLRYKEEVENLGSQIDKLMNLRTVKFKVKGTNEDATGLIAEEVVDVLPELVFKRQIEGFDEPQIDGVSYGDLPTYLLKAIQEQQEMINELKTEIQTLKSQINS
jgi:hypothetical protein